MIIKSKSIHFEKSGETVSVEIRIENISPNIKKSTIEPFINQMFKELKETIV